MEKRAIIYNCIDVWGKHYRFVEVCDKDKVKETAERTMSDGSPIVNYEECYVQIR